MFLEYCRRYESPGPMICDNDRGCHKRTRLNMHEIALRMTMRLYNWKEQLQRR